MILLIPSRFFLLVPVGGGLRVLGGPKAVARPKVWRFRSRRHFGEAPAAG